MDLFSQHDHVIFEKIERLKQEIEKHNHLYYQEAKPVISDFEFDQLLEQLIQR